MRSDPEVESNLKNGADRRELLPILAWINPNFAMGIADTIYTISMISLVEMAKDFC